jgi:hypothetical protein
VLGELRDATLRRPPEPGEAVTRAADEEMLAAAAQRWLETSDV